MMGDIDIGRSVFTNYHGELDKWHERVVMGHVENNTFFVATPDFDIYAEDLQQDAFIAALGVCMADGALPLGIDPAEVYGFAPITVPQ